jgi:hypothetical protein
MDGWRDLLIKPFYFEGLLYIVSVHKGFPRETGLKGKSLVQAGSAFQNANAT